MIGDKHGFVVRAIDRLFAVAGGLVALCFAIVLGLSAGAALLWAMGRVLGRW